MPKTFTEVSDPCIFRSACTLRHLACKQIFLSYQHDIINVMNEYDVLSKCLRNQLNTVSEKIILLVSSVFWHRKNKTLVRSQYRIHKWNSCCKYSDYLTNPPSFSKIAIFRCGQTIELNGSVRRIFILISFLMAPVSVIVFYFLFWEGGIYLTRHVQDIFVQDIYTKNYKHPWEKLNDILKWERYIYESKNSNCLNINSIQIGL